MTWVVLIWTGPLYWCVKLMHMTSWCEIWFKLSAQGGGPMLWITSSMDFGEWGEIDFMTFFLLQIIYTRIIILQIKCLRMNVSNKHVTPYFELNGPNWSNNWGLKTKRPASVIQFQTFSIYLRLYISFKQNILFHIDNIISIIT